MEEKQLKQLEIVRTTLASNDKAVKELKCAKEDLHKAIKLIVGHLDVYSVITGHSDEVLAASALVAITQQIEQLL